MSFTHVFNFSTDEIYNNIVCVAVFENKEQVKPIDVFPLFHFDECFEKLIINEEKCKEFNINTSSNSNSEIEKFEELLKNFSNSHFEGEDIPVIDFSIYEIIHRLNKDNSTKYTVEDFDNEIAITFLNNHYHVEFQKEAALLKNKSLNKKNIFAEIALENYYKERKDKFGF